MQLGELVYNALAIGSIGHAKPLALGGEDLDLGRAVVNHVIDYCGDKELGFGLVDILLEELDKVLLAMYKVIGCKAPEIH